MVPLLVRAVQSAEPHCVSTRLPRSLKPAQLKRAVLFKVGFGLTARAAASRRSRAGEQGEKNGKHVEAPISRDDCTLGGARRDNACLKKRKVRGGKGEGCGGNKMSYKE